MGPEHRRPRQEENVNSAGGGGGGLAEQTQPPDPGVPPLGAVGVWKAEGGQGTRETEQGAEGRDAASGCLADIQCQCGHIFWIYMALSLDCKC